MNGTNRRTWAIHHRRWWLEESSCRVYQRQAFLLDQPACSLSTLRRLASSGTSDLDIDVVLIHDSSCDLVLEALMCQYMTPYAVTSAWTETVQDTQYTTRTMAS